MIDQKNAQYQEQQQSLISPLVTNNSNNDNREIGSRLWFIPFIYIKKKWCMFAFFAFTLLYLFLCGCDHYSSAEESKHSDNCTAIPTLPWTLPEHRIPQNSYRGLRIGHDMTHRLHVMGGLVHVRRNDQADDIIVRFNLKLTNTDHAGLFYFRQHIDNDDTINIIMHIKEEEDEIYCILLDIDIEVPSALALSKLNIATSNSNIQVDDGMYFSQGVKLDTMDGNITVTNSGAGIMELNSESGFINCTSVQQTLGEQVIAHSTYGDINFKYADETSLSSRPISEILSRQHEKTWISLTSISGMVRSSMCTEMNVLFDSLRQMRTGIFARDFGGFGYGSNDIDKMFVNTVECTKSSLGTHHRGVWGSEDDINVHIITKTGSDSSTSIIFSCCNGDIKRTC